MCLWEQRSRQIGAESLIVFTRKDWWSLCYTASFTSLAQVSSVMSSLTERCRCYTGTWEQECKMQRESSLCPTATPAALWMLWLQASLWAVMPLLLLLQWDREAPEDIGFRVLQCLTPHISCRTCWKMVKKVILCCCSPKECISF